MVHNEPMWIIVLRLPPDQQKKAEVMDSVFLGNGHACHLIELIRADFSSSLTQIEIPSITTNIFKHVLYARYCPGGFSDPLYEANEVQLLSSLTCEETGAPRG